MQRRQATVLSCLVHAFLGSTPVGAESSQDQPGTTPDFLSNKRLLDPTDLAEKKEGGYVTGLPLLNSDPDTGIGFGARAYYYFNGERDDPFFPRTPYLHRVYAQGFFTTNGYQYHSLDYDGPYIARTAYRVRSSIIYEKNIAANYFGIGAASLSDPSFPGNPNPFSSIDDYDKALAQVGPDGRTYAKYHQYKFERPALQATIERDLFGGVVRVLGGFVLSHVSIHDFSGEMVRATSPSGESVDAPMARTHLQDDCSLGRILGCSGGWDNSLKIGLAYDTRDLEPNPTSGIFADISAAISSKVIGSAFNYGRLTAAPRAYVSPIPKLMRLVIAGRAFYSIQIGDIPFYSMNILSFTDGDRIGLGGLRTLRGYKQDRFVGKIAAAVNVEARLTVFDFAFQRQRFHLILVPFVDLGRTFDRVRETTLTHWKRGQGAAFRVAWNQATILSADYGVSSEGNGFYVNFGHQF